ncbi:MAG: S46 family peptidase [Ferruginibacter sp.]|nr:S46 family peptidase [Chitinophagaceae bacterium]MBP6286880.1 S46 family peptidase [Ferruginibacter sp.]MBU9935802.1 S46 family peptidase [Ferruginibacter sp.]HQY11835.1 S46 family peptidase [Ferruginibacter sp.]
MKRILIAVVLSISVFKASADEGMWLPMLLGQQVYNDMVKRGLKLTKEQLYSINRSSLKDAIIIFGGGCTGEIVSSQGLIFTNHHCGYGAISAASTVEHNYLRDGFYAYNKDQELKSQLTVQFLDRIVDVTKEVEEGVKGLAWADRVKKLPEVYKSITDKVADKENGLTGRIYSMFKGNQYIMYVYKIYRDIRLVGAPPESVGKFGGDTDNWEWPRHTGDFSVFRVYTGKDGKPADYSKDNVPLKPKHFLPVSIKGFKDGDYAMIYGYPGSTNRYETSYGIKLKNEIENPALVGLRDMRLKYMYEQMIKDPAVKLKLADNYAGVANYWKFFDGETKQLVKFNTYGQKQDYENRFNAWAKGKPEYENILAEYAKNYAAWTPYSKHRQYINEGIVGSPLIAAAGGLISLEDKLLKNNTAAADIKKATDAATANRKGFLEHEDLPSDEKILAAVCMMFYNDVDKSQHPIGFYEGLKASYGDLKEEATYKKWAHDVFTKTLLLDDAKWNAFVANPDGAVLQADPAFAFASAFIKNYNTKYSPLYTAFVNKNNELGRSYMKGIMEMNPAAVNKMYPDANFSMRVSYGNVKSYRPRDAVFYDYVTTSKGILEKYKAGDYEFDLPAKQVELLKKKDFGQYIDKRTNDLVVGFITTNDITGGNSGSPVIDANGNLLGLAFDGNYEALSHKIAFDKDLNRTICVDVRYVLWCIDKLGGAKNIIDELKLVR